MRRSMICLLFLAVTAWICGAAAQAQTKIINCHSCQRQVCQLEVLEAEEKSTAFEVKEKKICIPPIRFPWGDCFLSFGGGIRTVSKLESVERKRNVCEYNWSVKSACASCDKKRQPKIGGVSPPFAQTKVSEFMPTRFSYYDESLGVTTMSDRTEIRR